MPDVIELLEHDHREVEEMFTEFARATSAQDKRAIADKVIIEIVRHSEAEEQAVYPLMAKKIDGGKDLVETEIDEHSKAEKIMKDMDGLAADDPKLEVMMGQLKAAILQHIEEEEGEAFPRFREVTTAEERERLGTVVKGLKKVLPTHPHPMAPDHPPFNALLSPGAALVDRVRDLLTSRGSD